ncbi:Malectin-like domain [Dillenia turbinata]|uniref:Malectin-like domain n=1 Tax=Dillenia turbinata TaxID=194707 RepID=A0AAN8UZL9_9MAGN
MASLIPTLCLLLLSLSPLLPSTNSHFSPPDNHLINCGSSDPTTLDADNRLFTGDLTYLASSHSISLSDSNPHLSISPIYHSIRVFTKPSNYKFAIKEQGTHFLRLHFNHFNSKKFDSGYVQFHVLANGYLLLSNFTATNIEFPFIKEYFMWVSSDELVVTFVPSKRSKLGFVSAIEVISAPKDLIADSAKLVDKKGVEDYDGLMKQALETVFRVNVGGPKVTPFNDSVWRTWVPDDEFLKSSEGSERVYLGGRINYQAGGASREVGPDNVYDTARVIRSLNASIPKVNMTWVFPVVEGYDYLVRLHFCDIASISLGLLYFNVYVNGYLAYENLDLTYLTNEMLASPFYADFVIGGSSGVITVSVGPSKASMGYTVDAILNGVEIMKLNNSMSNLDGKVLPEVVLQSWPRENIGFLVPLVAAMCVFLVVSLVFRWKDQLRNNFGWTRLPVDVSEISLKAGNLNDEELYQMDLVACECLRSHLKAENGKSSSNLAMPLAEENEVKLSFVEFEKPSHAERSLFCIMHFPRFFCPYLDIFMNWPVRVKDDLTLNFMSRTRNY